MYVKLVGDFFSKCFYIYLVTCAAESRSRHLATSTVPILHPALSLASSRRFVIS